MNILQRWLFFKRNGYSSNGKTPLGLRIVYLVISWFERKPTPTIIDASRVITIEESD